MAIELRILVDTNVISYMIKADSRAIPYKKILLDFDTPVISFQTHAELLRWSLKHNWGTARKERLMSDLNQYEIVHSNEDIDHYWASIINSLAKRGIQISPQDAWVAATALYLEIPLLTHNAKDFEAVEGLQLISVP